MTTADTFALNIAIWAGLIIIMMMAIWAYVNFLDWIADHMSDKGLAFVAGLTGIVLASFLMAVYFPLVPIH